MTNPSVHINQTSGNTEYYTPAELVDPYRNILSAMGRTLSLDPASSAFANSQIVGAHTYFTAEEDGLSQGWWGNAWMNHPFAKGENACKPGCNKLRCMSKEQLAARGRTYKAIQNWRGYCIDKDQPGNADWIDKLVDSYRTGNVQMACGICYASTGEDWFKPLLQFPLCFISPRVNYLRPDGTIAKGNTKPSVIYSLGIPWDLLYKHYHGKLSDRYTGHVYYPRQTL